MTAYLTTASLIALFATIAPAPTAAPLVPAPPVASAPSKLADKLINQPQLASWSVFGAAQTTLVLPNGGPKNYPASRITVAAKGANAWDVGALSPIAKPIAAGDTVLVVVYLRAPSLKDGETTTISYFGVNESSAPYTMVAQASVKITNQWKEYYASGKSAKAYAASGITVGIHLANEPHVVDLGPVRAFDLGPGIDPARVPKNG